MVAIQSGTNSGRALKSSTNNSSGSALQDSTNNGSAIGSVWCEGHQTVMVGGGEEQGGDIYTQS